MMRNVPCVAGCCGPMLSVIPSVSSSTLSRASAACAAMYESCCRSVSDGHDDVTVVGWRPRVRSSSLVVGRRHRLDVDDAGPRLDHPGQQREVLAQRVALELARQVDVAQVGMTVEADPEHLVGLALVPVGAGVDGDPRVDRERVVGNVGLQRHADVAPDVGEAGEHLEPRLAAGVALLDLGAALRLAAAVGSSSPRRTATASSRSPTGSRSSRTRRRAATRPAARHEPRWRRGPRGRRSARGACRASSLADVAAQRVDDAFAEAVAGQRRSVALSVATRRRHSIRPPPTTIGV